MATANATSIDLTPLVGHSISGTVTGAGAGPLAGVQVFSSGSTGSGVAISNASGHFTIYHLAKGNYLLGEYMPDGLNFVSGQVQAGTVIEGGPGTLFAINGANVTGEDFSAPAGFRISGTLTGPGAAGAVAIPSAGPLDLCNCAEVPVGPDGTWQFVGLWPATYGVEFAPASAGAFDSPFQLGAWDGTSVLNPDQNAEAPIVVTSSDVTGIDAAIPAGYSLHGTVGRRRTG